MSTTTTYLTLRFDDAGLLDSAERSYTEAHARAEHNTALAALADGQPATAVITYVCDAPDGDPSDYPEIWYRIDAALFTDGADLTAWVLGPAAGRVFPVDA